MEQHHKASGADVDEMVNALEKAVRRHPGEPWRYELLASAYESRAAATSDLDVVARDLRMATRIRTELHQQGLMTLSRGEGPCQNETVPYMQVEQVKTQPAIHVAAADGPRSGPGLWTRLGVWALAATSPVLGWLLAQQPLTWPEPLERAEVVVIALTPIAHAGPGPEAASEASDDADEAETADTSGHSVDGTHAHP